MCMCEHACLAYFIHILIHSHQKNDKDAPQELLVNELLYVVVEYTTPATISR